MNITIPEHVLKNGPWSFSKAGVIQKCSLQYDFKYGPNKQPETPTPSPDSRVGVAVHKALEYALDGIKVKDAFRFAIDQGELTSDEVERVNSFIEQVERFVERIAKFKAKYGVTPSNVLIEHRVGLSPEFKNVPFFDKTGLFRGVIDFAMITGLGDAIIIDHKTGKQKEMAEYADQCKAYCVLAVIMRPEIRGVRTAINFVQTDQLIWNPYVSAETIRAEYIPWLVKFLGESTVKLLDPVKPTTGWWCGWCGYKDRCPEFKDK